MITTVLAFDFGASSGRAIRAVYSGEQVELTQVHRFDNEPITLDNGLLCWDFETLMHEVRTAIEKAGSFDSVGVDTWGVDYALLDKNDKLISLPVHYRDTRTNTATEKVFDKISEQDLYAKTGNQIMSINTLFQLMSENEQALKSASTLLFMPDLFSFMLCGKKSCEATIASTSQMLNLETCTWQHDILDTVNLPHSILQPIVASGTYLGELLPEYGKKAKVVSVAGHDTQCAVAAMPCMAEHEGDVAFLSCGTWSLLGTELDLPILTAESMQNALSNELGANGKINYLKNIIGLWLIQETRREYIRRGESYTYAQLESLALEATPFQSFIDPDSKEFAAHGDIPTRIQEFCRRTNQYVPQTIGEIVRTIYESLAFKYRFAIMQLEKITGKSFGVLHILGGGTKDTLLCRLTSDFCGLKVIAGPVEATALGNVVIQLKALGAIKSIDEARRLIAKTQKLDIYNFNQTPQINEAYNKFMRFVI